MERILIVESLESYAEILTEVLEGSGHQVTGVHSTQAAIKILGDMLTTGLYFKAIILGWDPKQDNSQLLSKLSDEIYDEIPVLTVADKVDDGVIEWLNRRQLTSILIRSAAPEQITETIDQLLTLAAGRRASRLAPFPSDEQIRVLFVDDSGTARNSYSNLLSANGYFCMVAEDAKSAHQLALKEYFDIAIIDYMMPEATGSDLCRQFKSDSRTRHIVNSILTSDYSDSIVKECLESGAVEFMFKSESHDLFIARVDSLSRIIQVGKSIENERRRLKGILSSVADGVYGIDGEGKITFMNAAGREILGFSDEIELTGKDPRELFMVSPIEPNLEELEESALIQAHVNGNALRNWETTFWCDNQQPISVECSVCPMKIEGQREGTVVAFRDISERKLFEEELRWQANHDSLTKLLNRHYFEKQLEQEVSRRSRTRSEEGEDCELSAMLYLDVDRFKYINDTAGHVAGDQLLIEIGHQLQTRLRGSDTLARLGGDEFAFILRDLVEEEAFLAGNRFRKILEDYRFEYKGKSYPVAGSLGAALIDGTALPGEVLANADLACHIAKGKGGNQVHVYCTEDEDRVTMNTDLGWSTRIKEALEENQFALTFQPIVHLDVLMEANLPEEGLTESASPWKALKQDGRTQPILFEVLLRMQGGEEGGMISPDMFLPTAERFNMMPDIDRWVIDHAFQTLAAERAQGRDIRFSVNLSGRTLVDKTLVADVKKLLQKHQLPGDCVTFEITETTAITNIDVAKRLITGLKEYGCKFALDDFGSGFSSFGHLKHLDVDYVKIDGLFTQGVLTDSMDRAVVQSINDIAHSFGKYTVAEYVDNREILRVLRETGVDYAQGYFISKPREQLGF